MAKSKERTSITEADVVDRRIKDGGWFTISVKHPALLPCPFCGNDKEKDLYAGPSGSGTYSVRCYKCGARTKPMEPPYRWDRKRGYLAAFLIRKAVAAWNRRT